MRRRGYSPGFAAGLIAAGGTLGILLPPSIVLILYAVAAEQSLGRLFLAGLGPGVLLMGLFAIYAVLHWRVEYRAAEAKGEPHAILVKDTYTMQDCFAAVMRVLPFMILLIGVMGALYGGIATPSEQAGLGAVMALVLGFFLPPVSIILMTAPIILPPLKAAGFDLVWFGIVMW